MDCSELENGTTLSTWQLANLMLSTLGTEWQVQMQYHAPRLRVRTECAVLVP